MRIEIKGFEKLRSAAKGARNAHAVIKDLLAKESRRFANEAVANIKENYLTGPRPEKLGVVTGRLRSSIRFLIDEAERETAIRFGTDVPYAAVHEFGGKFLRKRAFLQPGVEDRLPDFQERIEDMLQRVASEGIGGK